ncbi:hypothetical protein [Nocardioides sp. YIM 152315]|uniref:hypothetical protein n=1 Tax=Nocardioides sp. YIM 152315 TaxID=3031760 RepID=UPI0023D9DA0F|nr:hypothetical protein [Nocardioides sp. YIM 152315]MDF1604674.1 hypothetical protein [Nocardioides sp. YIM 152315]
MRTVTPAETTPVVVGHDGRRYTMTDYLGRHAGERADAGDDHGRQAYLVRQEAPELRAHFHEVDQFQVVLDGEGTLGRDRAVRGVVHYTDAFTSYGPIRTDPAIGLAYFTLRRRADVGIHYMPDERERRRLAASSGQHFTVALRTDDLPAARLHEVARTGRGAAAYGVRLPAGRPLRPAAGGGEGYLVVLDGALVRDGVELPTGSLVSFDGLGDLSGLASVPAPDDGAALAAVVTFPPRHD